MKPPRRRARPLLVAPALGLALLARAAPARAQGTASGAAFAALRAQHAEGGIAQASTLLAWGGASVLAGTVVAIAAPGGVRGRHVGIHTLAWGAVDVALAVPFLLQSLDERAAAHTRLPALMGEPLARARDDAIASSYVQATVFAVNTGLDVAYIATGALLWYLATRARPANDPLAGGALAAMMQGGFLLVFDAVSWGLAAARAGQLLQLRVPFP